MNPKAMAVLLPLLTTFALDDWPQHRGPQRTGISAETGILKSWPSEGPKVLWRIPFHEGYSGLSVVDGRIYTLYSDGSNEYLICLEAATGQELWKARVDGHRSDGQGGGPRSTPTVGDKLVYAVGAKNVLVAADRRTGAEAWRVDFKTQFGGRVPTWGTSGSPLIEGDKLIVEAGGSSGRALAMLDAGTGRAVWTSYSDEPSYSSPVVYDIGGVRQIVLATASGLVGAAVEDGEVLWTHTWKTRYDVNAATPIVLDGNKLFYSSGYGKGAVLLAIERYGGKFAPRVVWQSKVLENHFHSSIYKDGYLYGFDNAFLKCVDARTGEEKWSARGFQKGSMILADGHLIVLSERGVLALVEATPEAYREVAKHPMLEGRCWTSPVLADGKLYLRNTTEMLALDFAAAP